ncbi:hypothetical protein [Deinococcus ruber]|uniref:Uncharacterized protein n=1 Tax=Deinococcus ruber TaxID=1848197 RepID=A0A918C972_9DEIO|nr:hypothetical protein [Deinococcus ruber]GGR12878.1 hypothetical protein GCM10008957_27290 [Deinococcus ruber]
MQRKGSATRFAVAVVLTTWLSVSLADPTPIGVGTGASVTDSDPLTGAMGALDQATNTFSDIDSTISMLSSAIDMLSGIPVIGQIAMMIKPVLNTYLDFKTTAQPLFDAMTTGRQYLQRAIDTKNSIQHLFASSSFSDGVNTINNLVNQMGGLVNLPTSARTIDPNDPATSMQPVLAAADARIAEVQQGKNAAKAAGDTTTYRYLAQKETELRRLRGQLNLAGQSAATEASSKKLVTSAATNAAKTATDTTEFASTLQATKSAEGAIKALGTVALETMNAQSAGFSTLSQQLALISKQQTITNEQGDQLLQHFQAQQSEQNAQSRMALTQAADKRLQDYTSMLNRVNTLTDGIGQTMKPDPARRSNVRSLMDGAVP